MKPSPRDRSRRRFTAAELETCRKAHAGLYRDAPKLVAFIADLQAENIRLRFLAGESTRDLAVRHDWSVLQVEQASREGFAR